MPSILRGISALFVSMLHLTSAPSRAADAPKFTVEQLDQMLAPIVLFPDALLAQVRAPGGAKSYVRDGRLSDGFAAVAWPAHPGESGLMTSTSVRTAASTRNTVGQSRPPSRRR